MISAGLEIDQPSPAASQLPLPAQGEDCLPRRSAATAGGECRHCLLAGERVASQVCRSNSGMNPDKLFDYLDGKLSSNELAELEERLLSDPQLRRELVV